MKTEITISDYTKGNGGIVLSIHPCNLELAEKLRQELPKKLSTVTPDKDATLTMTIKHNRMPVPFTFKGDKNQVAKAMKNNIEQIAKQENLDVQVEISEDL